MDKLQIIFLIAAFGLGILIYRVLAVYFKKLRGKKYYKRGQKGEVKAEKLLKKAGWHIIKRQPKKKGKLVLDGQELEYKVQADFLVEKGKIRAIVEVKTGKSALKPATGKVRRQLFEYYHLYQEDKLIFVDAPAGKLVEVAFPEAGTINKFHRIFWFIAGNLTALASIYLLIEVL
ncbi:MAG: hypothetical protein PF689_12645 [Deltaproteobacteria bacterium]|nr:hypothetical protein [Deltaproteobacteria bacterium]